MDKKLSNIYKERIENIRSLMKEKGIDLYFIPMDDCHNSEYVGDHFKVIEFASGFTGSSAKMVITKDEALLWTDGRYFLQAEDELSGSGIKLMKAGNDGVPKVEEYINGQLKENGVCGFDGSVVSFEFAEKIKGKLVYDIDIAGYIWSERPAQRFSEIKIFDKNSGESSPSKIKRLRAELSSITDGDYVHIINSLDDIAWLFNIRADDIAYNPVAYAYALIARDAAYIFTGSGSVTKDVERYFDDIGVSIKDYNGFENDILKYMPDKNVHVLLDLKRISFDMYKTLSDEGYDVKGIKNPTSTMKAIKNETEIKNTFNAQLKDGVAVTKCMKWIKENAGCGRISECDVSDKLIELRKEQEGFIEPSFATISGYASNAAIIHYEPVRGEDAKIEAKGMLLVDSGGHYEDGTTDTTRTFILGDITGEERKCFTLVAASMLRLLDLTSRKVEGELNGLAADAAARKLIKENGYDYNHGTGHGIGYVMNVHEDPPHISHIKEGTTSGEALLAGMIMSDEPGIYVDGCFGIRIENDMLMVEKEDADGKYLAFENMTFVPIDKDGIDTGILSDEDVARLNNYNETVYNALEKRLDAETAAWLREYTRPL